MNSELKITVNDYQRLMGFVEITSFGTNMQGVASKLVKQLETAKLYPQTKIARNVVTMNSRVLLKDLKGNREVEITITYPQESEPRERRVSVFSEIGLALLGRKENDVVSWRVPNGSGQFQIEKVTYQPEAAGDYFL